ncbi:MAG: lipocalin family protein, partial [Chloroflexota bacterium]
TSPQSGATYPLGWDITIDGDYIQREESLTFQVIPLMAEQELNTDPTYWEGAVRVEGDVTGYGYNEMTGYADSVDGRF